MKTFETVIDLINHITEYAKFKKVYFIGKTEAYNIIKKQLKEVKHITLVLKQLLIEVELIDNEITITNMFTINQSILDRIKKQGDEVIIDNLI